MDWLNRVFVFWTGENEMSPDRRACLESVSATECDVVSTDSQSLPFWIIPSHPLPPAYYSLSAVHKSDYLRAYFMHYHGGGYTDIKRTSSSWRVHFEELANSSYLGQGYPEVKRGVADLRRSKVGGVRYFLGEPTSWIGNQIRYRRMKLSYRLLIGNGAFIFKPRSALTEQWLETVERHLDILGPFLRQNPARNPRDRPGVDFGEGPSKYPVPWSFLLGDILAPLSFRNHRLLLRGLPPPDFVNYE